ncbi:MAG: hypothetical protein PSX81_08600, partial [bacterium]|nr:hypothetical protein [bacterium]
MNLKFFIFYLFVFLFSKIGAQNFQWLKNYGALRNDKIIGAVAEKEGSCVFLLSQLNINANYLDTIKFDSTSFYLTSKDSNNAFLARIDSSGKIIKSRLIGDLSFPSICGDDSGNLYVAGSLNKNSDSKIIGSKILYRKDGNMLFFKYDHNFNLLWVTQNGNVSTAPAKIKYSDGHLYFIASSIDTSKLGKTWFYFDSIISSSQYGEIEMRFGKISWANYLFKNDYVNNVPRTLIINDIEILKSKIYAAISTTDFANAKDTFLWGSCIAIIDTLGKINNKVNIKRTQINCLSTDNDYLYFGGSYQDSLIIGSKKIKSQLASPTKVMIFSASLTASLNSRWIFQPIVIDKTNNCGNIYQSFCKEGFVYFGGYFSTKILIDSNYLTPGAAFRSDALIYKMDISGNVLWATSGNTTAQAGINAISAIPGKAVYVAGDFINKIKFGSHIANAKGLLDGFITKISDNSIIRGQVIAGPYCAGDSILIPFTKVGTYNEDNYFIAQLSNNEGNFDRNYIELGRVKSYKNGIVKGLIPALNINSSFNYRIRILSTSPSVQSYYKADTLKLLIYSKDKANPGPDVTICKGDTAMLKTFGGTKWTWSPAYKMADSTKNVTQVWPDKTTKYKIIIADSSGCGAPDTAFKTIYVRSDLNIQLPKDTITCIGSTISIIAKFMGGDSLHYTWQWYSTDIKGNYTSLKAGSNQLLDTLNFVLPSTEKDSQKLILFLDDGCSHKTAFATYRILISKQKPDVSFAIKDTLLCPNKKSSIIASFDKIHIPHYTWQWFENNASGFWLAGFIGKQKGADTLQYSLPLNAAKNKKLRVVLTDNCSNLKDTAELKIQSRDTLSIKLNTNDTGLCYGSNCLIKAKAYGGLQTGYSYSWTDIATNQILSNSDSLYIIADSSRQISVRVTDNCMPNNSSTLLTIKINPELSVSAQLKDTTLCYGEKIKLKANATGGISANYTYQWRINNSLVSNKDSLVLNTSLYAPKNGGVLSLQLILNDQCSRADTTNLNITVLPSIQIDLIKMDSICFNATYVFKAMSNGGKPPLQIKWLNQSNVQLSTTDSLIIENLDANKTGLHLFRVITNDGCSQPDTSQFQSYFRAPLSFQLTSSDSCPTSTALLNMNAKGGRGDYFIKWYVDNVYASASNTTLLVQPKIQTTTYKAVITDGCSPTPDTAKIQLSLKPILRLSVKGFCLGDTTIGKVTNSVFNASNTYNWWVNSSL